MSNFLRRAEAEIQAEGRIRSAEDEKVARRWCVAYPPNPRASLKIVCFPYAGGTAAIYQSWSRALPPQVEVMAIQLPGRRNRIMEPPLSSFTEVVQRVAAVLSRALDRPFVFFGHSLGALLAFEVSRALRRHFGLQPRHLFVSGRRAPKHPPSDEWNYDNDVGLLEHLRDLEGTPPELLNHPEMRELLLPALRADFRLVRDYEYVAEKRLSCPITVFGGTEDEESTPERAGGWREETDAACYQRVLPGDHFFIHSSVAMLLEYLDAVLRIELSHL